MGKIGEKTDSDPTPNPDVARGPQRFCKVCPTLVGTQSAVLGFVGIVTPTADFGGSWGPWMFCKDHLPADARAHQLNPIR